MRHVAVLLALVACRAESPPRAKPLALAAQADLARALDEAAQRGTWNELRRRWQGQTLRWTVTRQRLLCGSAEACNVAAFPIQRPATHGWMPELVFAPGQYDALVATCGDAEPCEVTIEGTLAKLEASDDAPTRLRLDDVMVVGH